MDSKLYDKYNVPGPRYTSYPTVPYWDTPPTPSQWLTHVKETFAKENAKGISLYIHLPFCETLCTFCGCHKIITKNHSMSSEYAEAVLKEWDMYLQALPEPPLLEELHLGGGTPTFFTALELDSLLTGILKGVRVSKNPQFSIEAHPNHTNPEQLQVLRRLGFRRVSYGVQDLDPKVQDIINRVQPWEHVEKVTTESRQAGFDSINFDLIYGLPFQTLSGIETTIRQVLQLRPERIAFYSYAHVPWIKPSQRRYTEADLPNGVEKRALYEKGRELFESHGYIEIGMDHFALPTDTMGLALKNRTLHRNFMGYTTTESKLMLGLGISAIGDAWTAFGQNVKTLDEYYEKIKSGVLPIAHGHTLTEEDLALRTHILNLMCYFETHWDSTSPVATLLDAAHAQLGEMAKDGLVELLPQRIRVTEAGQGFVRNVCMSLDARMFRAKPLTKLFSQTV